MSPHRTPLRRVLLTPLLVALSSASGCQKPGVCDGKDLTVEVSGNHGHTERVAKEALTKGAGRFRIDGDSHQHGFRLTDADVARLKAGEAIELRSTSMNAHVHELRVKCAR
jgi:hypothetical protein